MSDEEAAWEARLAELSQAFDAGFAAADAATHEDQEAYLAVSLGSDTMALSIGELGGVAVGREILPVRSEAALALIGLIGLRSRPVPVYSLGVLLARTSARASPWIVLTAGARPIGLAVDGFRGHVVAARSARVASAVSRAASRHVSETVPSDHGLLEIVNLTSLAASLSFPAFEQRATT